MERKIQNTNLLKSFLEDLKSTFSLNESLNVDATTFNSFELNNFPGISITVLPDDIIKKVKDQETKYDLIFESFPLGMKMLDWIDSSDKKHRLPAEYFFILESLKYLEENGIFITITPQSILFSQKGKEFESILNAMGYYFSAAFNLPDQFFLPQTSIPTILLAIRKGQNEKIFISELDYLSDYSQLLKNYFEGSSRSLVEGIFIPRRDFTSFENYKIAQQIIKLQTQYKAYKEYNLADVSVEIKATTKSFNEIDNTIYIPKIGNSFPIANLNEVTLKHQNYFQVILNPEIVNSKYMEVFFRSHLGILILGSLKKISVIPHVNKSDLIKIKIPIPDLETQDLILQTSNKINLLKEEMLSFESQLSLNPNSADKIKGVLDNTLNSLGMLNEEDQILELIRQGESKKVEFKETFSKDVKTNIKEKEKKIRDSTLKNIVAFLNSDGGTLLIGVKDNGEITGIENDNFENDDNYKLNFKNHIKDHIGGDSYPLINWKIVSISNKKVLRVDCRMSTKPFFLDGSEFYVRTNPSADKLEGTTMYNYINERFKS